MGRSASGVTTITGSEGTDLFLGIEQFQFSDRTIDKADGNVLVDDLYYLLTNRDVLAAGQDADAHYAAYGAAEGRDPNAFFSTKGYLGVNADVVKFGAEALTQYQQSGFKEGRDPSARFDNEFYLARHTDVRDAGLNPLEHYLQYGQAEGRAIFDAVGLTGNIKAGFDAEFYLLANADVLKAAQSTGATDTLAFARQHFDTYGWKEGRDPNAVFDTKGYLAAYGDVAAAGINPLGHYDTYGWKEGRDPSADFDSSEYLAGQRRRGPGRAQPDAALPTVWAGREPYRPERRHLRRGPDWLERLTLGRGQGKPWPFSFELSPTRSPSPRDP